MCTEAFSSFFLWKELYDSLQQRMFTLTMLNLKDCQIPKIIYRHTLANNIHTTPLQRDWHCKATNYHSKSILLFGLSCRSYLHCCYITIYRPTYSWQIWKRGRETVMSTTWLFRQMHAYTCASNYCTFSTSNTQIYRTWAILSTVKHTLKHTSRPWFYDVIFDYS